MGLASRGRALRVSTIRVSPPLLSKPARMSVFPPRTMVVPPRRTSARRRVQHQLGTQARFLLLSLRGGRTAGRGHAAPILPMRNTDKKIRDRAYLYSINVLSVKLISSDEGFLLNVYGNIILRDNLDHKCVYLFCRPSRMDSELINSEDQSLILTGPGRGLVLTDYIYIEVDLKMMCDQGKDKQLSIGLLHIDGRMAPWVPTTKVQRCTLRSSLSTVEVRYALVKEATEATVEFQVLEGDFKGEITAHTTRMEDSIHDRIVLHDSRACGAVTSSDGSRVIQLLRRVVAVCVDEMLVLTIVPEAAATYVGRFTPFLSGAQADVINCGAVKFGVKVIWSIISF